MSADREAFVPMPDGHRIKVRLVSRREKWMLGCWLVLSLAVVGLSLGLARFWFVLL